MACGARHAVFGNALGRKALAQRTPRKATEGTENPMEKKDEYRTGRERLISLWFSVILCVLCVALFGM
jgi:hypothetical protein